MKSGQLGQHKASVGQHSKGERDTLVIEHVLQAGVMGNWIVDSGATCHMSHDEILFSKLQTVGEGNRRNPW